HPARPQLAPGRGARADGLLRRLVVADVAPAPVPGGGVVHRAVAQARGDGLGDRGHRVGDLDGHPGWHRAGRHLVRTSGDERPREAVRSAVRCRRARPRAVRDDRGPRSRDAAETTTGGNLVTSHAAVAVSAVSKVFNPGTPGQVDALVDIDLDIRPGEFVSLIGPSGCGKSTLLRLMADLIEPSAGTVTVNGKSAHQARLDHDYGMAFQQAGLFEWRTVEKNIELPLELQGWDKARRRARAHDMLELVKLPEFARHMPWQLSGGMQQRIAIARALAIEPALLLMDEPFGALDEMTREHMQTELLRICDETGTTVVFVTHSIPEAVYLSDRVVVMSPRPGRIVDTIDVRLAGRADDADEVREAPEFYRSITEVREALRGIDQPTVGGVDDR